MKINVCIPSKNRPHLASAVITVLDQISSGENEILYSIGIDSDEKHAYNNFSTVVNGKVNIYVVPEHINTIGAIWNFLARLKEADAYMAFVDDAFPLNKNWDLQIKFYTTVMEGCSWNEPELGELAGYPVMSDKLFKVCGYLCAEHFPFWFCDSWFQEIYRYAFCQEVPMSTDLKVGSRQEKTHHMRDLSFWWGFFNATRTLRVKKGYAIFLRFNQTSKLSFEEFVQSRKYFINLGIERDKHFYGDRIKEIEALRIEDKPPTKKYLKIKEKAEAFLVQNGLKIWENMDCIKSP